MIHVSLICQEISKSIEQTDSKHQNSSISVTNKSFTQYALQIATTPNVLTIGNVNVPYTMHCSQTWSHRCQKAFSKLQAAHQLLVLIDWHKLKSQIKLLRTLLYQEKKTACAIRFACVFSFVWQDVCDLGLHSKGFWQRCFIHGKRIHNNYN